jgi:hypothetical protein
MSKVNPKRDLLLSQQKFWLDQNSFMQEALEKARQESKQQAEHDRNIEIAKNAVQAGIDNRVFVC